MTKVFLTGGEGFTGRYLKNHLQQLKYTVSCLGYSSRSEIKKHPNLLTKDVLLQELREFSPDVIIHLAAVSSVDHKGSEDFVESNIEGTRNLLEVASSLSKKPRQIVLASSANVYGNASTGKIAETAPTAPENEYASSKLSMEGVANDFRDSLPITIVRPFNYTGRGQSTNFLVPKIVAHFKQRSNSIDLGNINVLRDFSDVRDVVSAYQKLILNPNALDQTVNIGSGIGFSIQDIFCILERLTKHNMTIRVNPNFVRKNEVKELVADVSKLHRVIGNFDRIPIDKTLNWMLED